MRKLIILINHFADDVLGKNEQQKLCDMSNVLNKYLNYQLKMVMSISEKKVLIASDFLS